MARAPRSTLRGDRALAATLSELGSTFGGAALDAALRKGLTPIKQDAPSRVQGPAAAIFRRDIKVQKTLRRPRNRPEFKLGFVNDGQRIAHLFEFGTQRHSLRKGASVRRRIFLGAPPMHPGDPPRPFMRPAFEARKDEAAKIIQTDLVTQIQRQARRLEAKNRNKR